jgi:leader peptidase (prepilin peptidase)/N-methyltransferase
MPLPLQIFLTAWFFYVGACIGSFMNVVIFRLPRGRSVVSPGSRCPRCGAAIRGRDNLPIVSWLLLGAKCRDCRTPISARYPIVELLVGLFFLALFVETLLPGGPWWMLNILPGEMLVFGWPKLALVYVFYVSLGCTLICASYIAWDGERVPRRMYLPAIVLGAVAPMYWVEVRLLQRSYNSPFEEATHGLLVGLQGLLLAWLLGAAFDFIRNLRNERGQPRGRITLALCVVGWMLGPTAVLLIGTIGAVLALVWLVLTTRSSRGSMSAPLAGITIAAIALLLGGRLVNEHWPQHWHTWRFAALIVAGLAIMMMAAVLLRRLAPKPAAASSSLDVMYP